MGWNEWGVDGLMGQRVTIAGSNVEGEAVSDKEGKRRMEL